MSDFLGFGPSDGWDLLSPHQQQAVMDAEDDARERAAVGAMPEAERPHYELNDGTCVTCGEPWMCPTAEATP